MSRKKVLEEYASSKIEELKKIFKECGEEMGWEKIEMNVNKELEIFRERGMVIKEENRELNEKNINEKRATKSPKERECQKRWGVEDRE
ncbi:hypothetical protein RhiirA4_487693 [Rhizophagus irregularis]|uniref:Uncharacterized protein n=1 Tax=Rhizophagus irregularis TaxID=588596 RepID=A0A2I1HSY7_9GLOM|nr:hypothetical protein RhiirA4_487693 [Rhizophagus irregularis]